MERVVLEIKEKLQQANNIAIFTHVNCDCDGIGSMLGLYNYLIENGKNVSLFCDSDIPERFSFLNGISEINKLEKETGNTSLKEELKIQNKVNFKNFDLLISLDTSSSFRLGKYEEIFNQFYNTINIDHHVSNSNYAKINCVKAYSSCGEVIYEVLKNCEFNLSPNSATCLYAAISSDTNRFSNQNITEITHRYAGELLALKADHNLVNLCLFKNKNVNQLNLISYMTKNLKFYKGISYFYMSLKLLKKLNVKSSDVSTFMYILCNVGEAKINIIIKERGNGEFRLSLRSVGDYDVNKIARVFGGGGHKNAGGLTLKGNFKREFKKLLSECLMEIKRVDLKS